MDAAAEFVKLCLDPVKGLQNTIKYTSHFPSVPEYSELLKLRARSLLLEKNESAIHDLVESHAITTRHHAINLNRMSILKDLDEVVVKPPDESADMFGESDEELLPVPSLKQLSIYAFDRFDHMEWSSTLPQEWTIVHVTELPLMRHVFQMAAGNGGPDDMVNLAVTRFACGEKNRPWTFPVTEIKAPSGNDGLCAQGMITELRNLVAANSTVTSEYRGNREAYWKTRQQHHYQLKTLVSSLENRVLGHWKCLFLGTIKDPTEANNLRHLCLGISEKLQAKGAQIDQGAHEQLHLLLSAYPFLSREQIIRGLSAILKIVPKDPLCAEALSLIDKSAGNLNSLKESSRNPVILVLDKIVQEFPWESMSVLSNNPVSRVPSMHILRSLVVRHCLPASGDTTLVKPYVELRLRDPAVRVDPKAGFYVINPGCDLEGLQKRLLPVAQKLWGNQGFAGEAPLEEKLRKLLTESDVFLYCGHGSGTKYLSGDKIIKLENPAAPVLMGCSSGKLSAFGKEMEPTGTVISYLIAGSPCFVGMLWDVTDVDCDRFTLRFLDLWLGARKGEVDAGTGKASEKGWEMPPPVDQLEPEMLRAVAKSRGVTKLLITGGAAIVYGLPARAVIEE